jgi:hypothetical protein
VQVELRQELADFLRPAAKQRQYAALESRLETTHPRSPHVDRSAAHRKSPPLAEPVPIPRRAVDRRLAPALDPAQNARHFLFEKLLHPVLDLPPRVPLQLIENLR